MGMKSVLSRALTGSIAGGTLAACTGSGFGLPSDRLSGSAPAAVPGLRASWIDPGAKSSPLLYVSDQNASTVYIYAYPSLAPAGQITGFNLPSGLCVNRRTGDVWVTDAFASTITEFAHG